MKVSKYNIVERHNDLILLFNSYSGKLLCLKWDKAIYDALCGKISIDSLNEIVINKLYEFDFFIDDGIDEDKLVELKKFDFIYNSALKLEIIPTLLCNFQCAYCYEEHNGTIINETIINSIKLFVSKYIGNYSSVEIFWFGGEPLLARDAIININSYVKEIAARCNKKFFSSITTNGYLLNSKTFDELCKAGVKSYNITFDGAKKFHDEIRFTQNGEGSYDKIIDNLKQISKKAGFYKITLRCNITKSSIVSINEFITEINELFAYDERFKVYFRPVGDWGGQTVKSMKDELLNGNYEIYDTLFTSTIQKSIINFDYQFLWSGDNNLCEANQRNYFVINYNGDILKCTKHLNNNLNIIGKIAENGNLIIDKFKMANWILPQTQKHSTCLQCKSYANCFSLQCAIDCHNTCECSELFLKQQLKLQYLYNRKDFIEI